jgi:hypothetical protein
MDKPSAPPLCKKARKNTPAVDVAVARQAAISSMVAVASYARPSDISLAALLLSHKSIEDAAACILLQAATDGNEAYVRLLLDGGVDPAGLEYRGMKTQPLSKALVSRDVGTVMALLEAGAPIDPGHFHTVCNPAMSELVGPMARRLSPKVARECRLFFVIRHGLTDTLKVLLSKKASMVQYDDSLLEHAVYHHQPDCIKVLLSAKAFVTPDHLLKAAAIGNDVAIAKLLTRHKVSFTTHDAYNSALRSAIHEHAIAGLRWLLKGATCLKPIWQDEVRGVLTRSLNRYIGGYNDPESAMVQSLLWAKATVTDASIGHDQSTLIKALYCPDILQLLLMTKANPNVGGIDGEPIMFRPMSLTAATLLVEAKVDLTARSTDNLSLLNYVHHNTNWRELGALLRAHDVSF